MSYTDPAPCLGDNAPRWMVLSLGVPESEGIEGYLSMREAEELYQVPIGTIAGWCAHGRADCRIVNHTRYILPSEMERAMVGWRKRNVSH